MLAGPRRLAVAICFAFLLTIAPWSRCTAAEIASWHGILRDTAGHVVGDAAIVLHAVSGDREYTVKSSASGQFAFVEIASGSYTLRVTHDGNTWNAANPVVIADGVTLVAALELATEGQVVRVMTGGEAAAPQGRGGQQL